MDDAQAQLIAAVEQALGPKAVDTNQADIEPWVSDWRGRVHGASPAILSPASTDEVAAMVRFLCGPGGAYITGQTIHVNGGQTMF